MYNNLLLISTSTNYSAPLKNTSFITSSPNTHTTDISFLFQQEDYFDTTNITDNLNNTNPLFPYCSYSPSLKRQRPYVPRFPLDNFALNNNDGWFPNPLNNSCFPTSQLDEFLFPTPTNTTITTTTANEVSIAQPAYSDYRGGGYVETSNGKKCNSGRYLSAQSVAARERRRKISQKTQQLGKLVPGGSKLSTADMFHAAYKYIKFLQAQIGVLEFMVSIQEMEEGCLTPHLGVLLTSLPIQEKLYAQEKCLISSCCIEIMRKTQEII
ncbi:transcription factor bHLH52-like [Papaver somniferum]|uniref:transcription factor bHLH52-like n=1 Tax=Papaver somniferum TaxID=3469 RepID=UPI000E6F8B7F|nr:transcription factor bHLH52-like [Papaver somniferum]